MACMSVRNECNKCGKKFLASCESLCPDCKQADGDYAVLADVLAEFQKHGNTSPERFEMTWDTLEQILSKYFS